VMVLMQFVQKHSKTHRFDGPQRLRFALKLESAESRFEAAEKLLAALALPGKPVPMTKKK
jgi:hypothetical protein